MMMTLKTLLLLTPIAWTILHGPMDTKVFILVGLFAVAELTVQGRLARIGQVWPMILLGGLYAVINFLSPKIYGFQVADFLDSYNYRMICATVFYAIPAGFCLAAWGQKGGQKYTFLGYALFCLSLAVIGWQLINMAGADQFVQVDGDEIDREAVDGQGVQVLLFPAGNLMIDAIPMSIFAVTALSATLVSKWLWPRLVLWFAAGLGIYFNVMVATRTMILAAFVTLAILAPLQVAASKHRKKLLGSLLIIGAFGIIFALLLKAANIGGGSTPLAQRFLNMGGDARIDVWREAVPLVFDYPAGGGIVHLSAESWGHNLFLDCALINGLLGALVMLTLYGFIFFVVVRGIRQAGILAQPLGIALVGGFMGSFLCNMVHPPQPAFIAFALMVGSYAVASMMELNGSQAGLPQISLGQLKFHNPRPV